MKYGYFDDINREYVITRPDTPAPWVNYLGSPEYGALISGNAGGYSFAKSGAKGRILRYVFNQFDQPGRYIYLRDKESGYYWSASWQPVGKSLDIYKSECRHGMGYTVIASDYSGIHGEATYYVPKDKTFEVWSLTVRNDRKETCELTVTGYAEFTNVGFYENDQVNLQYSQFVTCTEFYGNRLIQKIHGNQAEQKKEDGDNPVAERFFCLTGNPVSSYCGDRAEFLGSYRQYGNPIGVESGDLGNVLNYNENACGALSTEIKLAPGQSMTIDFILGEHDSKEAEEISRAYDEPDLSCKKDIDELKAMWQERLSALQVKTPSPEFDTMINTWNAYNCYMTFIWSRAASFTYCGLRNGYGYRDTVQDIQGVIHLQPDMAAEKIRFMLSAQVDSGAGLPLVKFTHNPGHEDTPDDFSYVNETGHPAYRADDALWLFPTVYKYIAETGNLEFLNEVIPYANRDESTVYEHLKRALNFSKEHLGSHGMPAGLYADWNDCLRLGAQGESAFVAMQFYYAYTILEKFAEALGDTDYLNQLIGEQKKLHSLLDETCWNEDRYIRGYTEDGESIGHRDAPEANMWLNPQTWSVISGLASREQAEKAMDLVYERLNTAYGAILMDPPYHAHAFDGAIAVIYNQGVKENSAVFSQTQGWLVLAEALLGHGDRAFMYYKENAPSMQNDSAELRKIEPYCYGQFTEGKHSPHFGRSHVHWLTGTASTMMVGCVEGILGLRPSLDGIYLSPSIPSEWKELKIRKIFRKSVLNIVIRNPESKESGCTQLIVNGVYMKDNFIPAEILTAENEIEMIM